MCIIFNRALIATMLCVVGFDNAHTVDADTICLFKVVGSFANEGVGLPHRSIPLFTNHDDRC